MCLVRTGREFRPSCGMAQQSSQAHTHRSRTRGHPRLALCEERHSRPRSSPVSSRGSDRAHPGVRAARPPRLGVATRAAEICDIAKLREVATGCDRAGREVVPKVSGVPKYRLGRRKRKEDDRGSPTGGRHAIRGELLARRGPVVPGKGKLSSRHKWRVMKESAQAR